MLRTALLGLLSVFTIASSVFAAGSESAKKDSLTTVLNFEVDTLNPVVATSVAAHFVLDTASRYPMSLDIAGHPFPFLIKQVPTVANHQITFIPGSDKKIRGMKVSLEFLPKASWADGVPVTCEDLKFTWEVGSSLNVSVPSRDLYTDITDVKVDSVNPKKCSLFFKKAEWSYYLNIPRLLSAHLERPIFEKYKNEPQAYERNSLYVREPGQAGLWNGPYRVVEYKLGEFVRLVPNEHFYGKSPYFKNFTFKFIMNSATIEANLLSGSIDMVSSTGFTLDQALVFEKRIEKEHLPYKMQMKPSMTFSFMDCNLDNPILSDVRVRKALSYMVNREELINSFYGGRLTAAYSFANPIDSYYTTDPKEIQIYKYSKTKANQLLDEAGWKMKEDGFRYKDGKPLKLSVAATADLKIIETIEVFIKNAWKSVGINMQIKNVPGRVLFSQIVPRRNFDLAFYSMSGSPDDDHRTMFHSSFIPSEKNSYSGQNSSGWKNADVDKWLDQEEVEFDAKKRKPLMQKIMRAYNAELPSIPLYYRSVAAVIPAGLQGYDFAPHQFSEYSHIEDWKF